MIIPLLLGVRLPLFDPVRTCPEDGRGGPKTVTPPGVGGVARPPVSMAPLGMGARGDERVRQ
jgi:hypothetical protein